LNARYFAIWNPAAGGGRSRRLAPSALSSLREQGIEFELALTKRAGDATEIARRAYQQGFRRFIAIGGDGTAYEILNGLFPEALSGEHATLALFPVGTGNSFMKDFSSRGIDHTLEVLRSGRLRTCDVIRLSHTEGEIYYLNLASIGFPAEVCEVTNRRFKRWGELGYLFGVFTRLVDFEHVPFPHRVNGNADWDRRPCLFLSFSNSKFTGGKMMIAPKADATDGQIEYVRWSPISRLGLIKMLPRLFTGTHIEDPRASRAAAQKIELALDGPVNVLVDGEVLRLNCRSLEVLPATLDVAV
jgi:diacylglycerol kinase (ATP)